MQDLQSKILEMCREADFLEPRPGRLIVVRDAFKYGGALYIPEKYRQLPTTGRVVRVGDDDHAQWIGKRIVWGRYSGVPVQFDGKPAYDVLTYEEVIAFLNNEDVKLSQEDLSALTRE